jgi:dTMP kinase
LFAAARDDHVRATIEPALDAGKWVICDRFIDSTRVYQGVLGKVDMKLIRGLERVTVGAVMPDVTFLLDVPANIGLARAKARRGAGAADRFEAESVDYHEELRKAFLTLAEREPKRFVVVDGRAPRDVVAGRVWAAVERRLLGGDTPVAESAAP